MEPDDSSVLKKYFWEVKTADNPTLPNLVAVTYVGHLRQRIGPALLPLGPGRINKEAGGGTHPPLGDVVNAGTLLEIPAI